MNDPHSSPIRPSTDFVALCEQLQDRSLSYSDRESLVKDAKSQHYQIQFKLSGKRNCYSSGPDGSYRDGITLEGSLSDSEATVRVSFKAEAKAAFEDMQEDDSVTAVVLLERWSSGLREWEAWAIDRQADDSPVIPPVSESHSDEESVVATEVTPEESSIAESKADGDSSTQSESLDGESTTTSDPDLQSETDPDSQQDSVVETNGEAEQAGDKETTPADPDHATEAVEPSEQESSVTQEDLAAAAAIFETEQPSDYIGEILDAFLDSSKGANSDDTPSTLLTPQEIVDDSTAVVPGESSSRPRVGTKENPVPTMSVGVGCFCFIYTIFEVCLLEILSEEPVALIIGGLPYVFILRHLLAYRRKFRTLGPEHGYTVAADRQCRTVIMLYSGILVFHVLFLIAGDRVRF